MKHQKITFNIVAALAIVLMVISGCESDSFSGDADLETNIDSVSYAFGYLYGQQMSQQGMDDLNPETLAQGMQAALNEDSSLIKESNLQGILRSYQMKAQAKLQRKRAAEAQENKEAGEKFLAENKDKEGVQSLESGLQYKVLEKGDGVSPSLNDTVVVSYTGTLLDGTEFDSNEEVEIPLIKGRLIEGWIQGIPLMETGATYKFWIPGDLAYGANPRPGGPIGPNETLVFEVELLEVK